MSTLITQTSAFLLTCPNPIKIPTSINTKNDFDEFEPYECSDVTEVVNRIKEHLRDIPERELKLRVERPLIHNREIQHLLRGHPAVYDPERGLLVVRYMAGPLHAAVGSFASHLKDSIVDAGLITMGDRHKIIINPLPQMLAGRIPIPGENVKKPQAWTKIPDASFVFRDAARKKMKPAVIFEVGFSEGHHDLIFDKEQWLTKNKYVRLVVLVDIKENRKMRQLRWKTPECQQRVSQLVKDFANSDGRAYHECHYDKEVDDEDRSSTSSVDSVDSVDSGASMYEEIEKAIEVNDWVGSIKADIEVWERGPSGLPHQRGTQVVSYLLSNANFLEIFGLTA
jgi:hypothetical protein